MEHPKNRRRAYIIGVLLAVLLVGALCTGSYMLGVSRREKEKGVSVPVARQDQEAGKSEKKAETATQESLVISGSGVSLDAVTAQAVEQEQTKQEVQQTITETNSATASSQAQASLGEIESPVGFAGKLEVIGGQLCTAAGNPVQLRGVSTHGLSWYPEYVNGQMFAELKGWGANTVRLAMYTAEYNGYCTGDEANRTRLKKLVKEGVRLATEQNLYVIIDWHILSDGNPNTYKAQAIDFFAEMAEAFRDNDHVLYEICNEPNGGTNWSSIKSYANEVIEVIRARDSDGVILVGTPTWSQEVDQAAEDPITGYSNVMYTLHFYADTHRDSLRKTMEQALQKGLPVFVSEFGICDASGNGGLNTAQGDAWIQLLNQYGVSYVAWSLCNKSETSALLQAGCTKTSGITEGDLSESGKWLLKILQGSAAVGSAASNSSTNSQNPSSQELQGNAQESSTADGNEVIVSKTPEQYAPVGSSGVEYTAVNSWQEGAAFCIQYELKISGAGGVATEGWSGMLTFPGNVALVSGWNANFSVNGNALTFTNMDYNKSIPSGGRVEGVGCIVRLEE